MGRHAGQMISSAERQWFLDSEAKLTSMVHCKKRPLFEIRARHHAQEQKVEDRICRMHRMGGRWCGP